MLVAAGAFFCYATQALAGWLAWQMLGGGRAGVATKLGAALLVGPGLVTVQMVAYHALGVPFAVAWLALPWWAGFCVWLSATRRRPAQATMWRPRLPWSTWCLVGLCAVVTLAVAARAFALPIHDGDEVNNFTLFAKVFGSLGSLAPARLSSLMEPGHVEYPHLVALNQAWLFALDADSAPWTARGFEVLAVLSYASLCIGVFAPASTRAAAACALCLASPAVLHVAVGFADVRLLATFVLLGQQAHLALATRSPNTLLRLALVLGTAALTKNEGLAVAAGGVVVLLLAALRQRSFVRGGAALALAVGLLTLWPLLRRALGFGMPYVDRAFALPLDVLAAQAPRVLVEFARLMFPLDAAGLLHSGLLFWLATPIAVVLARRDAAVRWLCLAWGAHVGLYIYVLGIARPGDLQALLGTAAPRLVLHTTAWPISILARAMSLRPAPQA